MTLATVCSFYRLAVYQRRLLEQPAGAAAEISAWTEALSQNVRHQVLLLWDSRGIGIGEWSAVPVFIIKSRLKNASTLTIIPNCRPSTAFWLMLCLTIFGASSRRLSERSFAWTWLISRSKLPCYSHRRRSANILTSAPAEPFNKSTHCVCYLKTC